MILNSDLQLFHSLLPNSLFLTVRSYHVGCVHPTRLSMPCWWCSPSSVCCVIHCLLETMNPSGWSQVEGQLVNCYMSVYQGFIHFVFTKCELNEKAWHEAYTFEIHVKQTNFWVRLRLKLTVKRKCLKHNASKKKCPDYSCCYFALLLDI